jgi:hypothetical protein
MVGPEEKVMLPASRILGQNPIGKCHTYSGLNICKPSKISKIHEKYGFNSLTWLDHEKWLVSPCHKRSRNYLSQDFEWENMFYISAALISSKAGIDCWSAIERKLNIVNKTICET